MGEALNLGDKVMDRITGLEGTVVAVANYLYGTTQIGVQLRPTDGKLPDIAWFDEPRLEKV